MAFFEITPEAIAAELLEMQNKLSDGAINLASMDGLTSGVTAHDIVFERDKLRLLHYKRNESVTQNTTPLLIVYSLINRPYLADFSKGRSLVQGLLDAGQDVYLIDWGYPDANDRFTSLDDYLNGALDACVDEVCKRHNTSQLNMLGICQGGTFSLCYSALYPAKIRNLVTTVTPVDFHTPDNMLGHWAKNINTDKLVDTLGNIPGHVISRMFTTLRPYRQIAQKYRCLVDIMDDTAALKKFMQLEKWLFDSPDQAGEAFRQFLKDIVQQNKLITGQVVIGTQAVDLKQINMPVFNVYAEQDNLVPPASAKAIGELISSEDYLELSFNSGHIGPFVSGKGQKIIPAAIAQWLNKR